MHRPSIAIIGAGAVGSTIAYALTIKNLAAEVMLIDVNEKKEEGEVMDISDAMCFVETGCVTNGNFRDARGADIIIITAGVSQKPGDTRLDLLTKNANIVRSVFKGIGRLKKTAIIIIVTNPVDVITYLAQTISGLPHNQVFGSGTTLDTARLRKHVGETLGVSSQNVHGYVMGEHGNSQFVAWSSLTVGGMSAAHIKKLSAPTKNVIEKKVQMGAYDIIERKGATYYGIGLTVTDIVEAIIYNQYKILPVSARLTRWNGVSDICLGVPAIIAESGIQGQWPMSLPSAEKKKLWSSAETIRDHIKAL
ncbi:MAG: L-lactate dehydrogenase [Candidatus Magasanikbacteria bacterium CG10_big_fil_rev_8_21_14_0_10_47_10]|uniref:L-lactate dehydrogenase n=1 Tax=Candidatus Magasanikbacteria bacterium CG10_big_fil_rev_8_21_14_0_10_47_10 TaxID=1974652 RepID=A0A2H0TQ76_9BACT|nr:MAG: L-lactate dehydrogenase [Candidatus Magasanikbacteria bacterium CG10_big_fil_rev_8_21_14_0_10_47_10]